MHECLQKRIEQTAEACDEHAGARRVHVAKAEQRENEQDAQHRHRDR